MSSVRENILAAIVAALGTAPAIGATVHRSRVTALGRGESPAIIVEPVNDQSQQATVPKLDWALQVRVAVIARGDAPDQVADPYVANVHKKIMADMTLGGLCYDVQPLGVTFDLVDADNSVGVVSMTFQVLYRTGLQDVTVS